MTTNQHTMRISVVILKPYMLEKVFKQTLPNKKVFLPKAYSFLKADDTFPYKTLSQRHPYDIHLYIAVRSQKQRFSVSRYLR